MGRLNRPSAVPMDTHVSVEVRKIDNGYLVRHSESGPKGYKSREVYHAEKPALAMGHVGGAVKEQSGKPKAEPKKAAQPGTSALKKAAGGKRK